MLHTCRKWLKSYFWPQIWANIAWIWAIWCCKTRFGQNGLGKRIGSVGRAWYKAIWAIKLRLACCTHPLKVTFLKSCPRFTSLTLWLFWFSLWEIDGYQNEGFWRDKNAVNVFLWWNRVSKWVFESNSWVISPLSKMSTLAACAQTSKVKRERERERFITRK